MRCSFLWIQTCTHILVSGGPHIQIDPICFNGIPATYWTHSPCNVVAQSVPCKFVGIDKPVVLEIVWKYNTYNNALHTVLDNDNKWLLYWFLYLLYCVLRMYSHLHVKGNWMSILCYSSPVSLSWIMFSCTWSSL